MVSWEVMLLATHAFELTTVVQFRFVLTAAVTVTDTPFSAASRFVTFGSAPSACDEPVTQVTVLVVERVALVVGPWPADICSLTLHLYGSPPRAASSSPVSSS